jgi:hypothetical protein
VLDSELAALGDLLKRRVGARAVLERQAEALQRDIETHRKRAGVLNHVVALLAAAQEMWRGGFEAAVSELVSPGLTGVFGEPLTLVVEMGIQGDLPVAHFFVMDSTGLKTELMEADGGGLVNVTSFLLHTIVLLAARPSLGRLLILDESFGNLSADFLPQAAVLLRRICEEGRFQLIVIAQTGREALVEAGDVVYDFAKRDGVTKVRQLRAPESWPNA